MALNPVQVIFQAVDRFTAPVRQMGQALNGSLSPAVNQARGNFTLMEARLQGLRSRLESTSQKLNQLGQGFTTYITLPVLGAATASVHAFLTVDDALDSLAAKTGKTGQEMEALEASFRKVAASAPDSVDAVANTMAELQARTGASGAELEKLTMQTLDLARVTGVDAAESVNSLSRAMQDSSEPIKDAGKFMDMLLAASQKTGVPVQRLSDLMTQFGRPMRSLGFDAQQTAALLSKFEKEGVNTELVMGSLRVALGKMAKAGVKDVGAGLQTAIQKIKEAKTAGERTTLAIELFGQKAGPDMAAAVYEGRFEIGQFVNELKNSQGAVAGAVDATSGLGEQWAQAKNQLMFLGESIAANFMPLISSLVEKITAAAQWFMALPAPVQNTVLAVTALAAAIGPLFLMLAGLASGINAVAAAIPLISAGWALFTGALMPAIAATWAFTTALLANPFTYVVLGIAALIGGLVALVVYWDEVKQWIMGFWAWLMEIFRSKIGFILALMMPFIALPLLIIANWATIKEFFATLWQSILEFTAPFFEWLAQKFGWILEVPAMITNAWQGLVGFFSGLWNSVGQIFEDAKNWLKEMLDGLVDILPDWVKEGLGITGTVEATAAARPASISPQVAAADARQAYQAQQNSQVQVNFANTPQGTRLVTNGPVQTQLRFGANALGGG